MADVETGQTQKSQASLLVGNFDDYISDYLNSALEEMRDQISHLTTELVNIKTELSTVQTELSSFKKEIALDDQSKGILFDVAESSSNDGNNKAVGSNKGGGSRDMADPQHQVPVYISKESLVPVDQDDTSTVRRRGSPTSKARRHFVSLRATRMSLGMYTTMDQIDGDLEQDLFTMMMLSLLFSEEPISIPFTNVPVRCCGC